MYALLDNNNEYDHASYVGPKSNFLTHGTEISGGMGALEIMKAADLDWEVEKRPLKTITPDGTEITIPNRFAVCCAADDTVFDIAGPTWQATQNKEFFDVFEKFTQSDNIEMIAAGASAGGRHVYGVARLVRDFKVAKNDTLSGLFCFSNPHIHGKSMSVQNIGERFMCANQISVGGGKNTLRFRHAENAFDATEIEAMIGGLVTGMKGLTDAAKHLIKAKMDRPTFVSYLRDVYGLHDPEGSTEADDKKRARNANALEKLLITSEVMPGASSGRGTWWQALNTVTYTADHVAFPNNREKRLDSALNGPNAKRKAHAYDLALEYANAA